MGTAGSLPSSAAGQSCAFCGTSSVRWVHSLDQDHVRYRVHGKEHTLPHFLTVCDRCEQLYLGGNLDGLFVVMMTAPEWSWTAPADVDERVRKPLAVFARADRGARPLSG